MSKPTVKFIRPKALKSIDDLRPVAEDHFDNNQKLREVYITDDGHAFINLTHAKQHVLNKNSPALYIYWYHRNGRNRELPIVEPDKY